MKTNTIYKYYEKISDRYYLARIFEEGKISKVRHLWQPMAKPVKIPGFEDFDLFVYKEKAIGFCLCEALTGAVLISQNTMGTRFLRRCSYGKLLPFFEDTLVKRGGKAELNILIVNFLNDYDQSISPRYFAIKL
jgi:hypothetical protein